MKLLFYLAAILTVIPTLYAISNDKIRAQQLQDPYPWVAAAQEGDMEIIIVGDINIQKRADPAGALG